MIGQALALLLSSTDSALAHVIDCDMCRAMFDGRSVEDSVTRWHAAEQRSWHVRLEQRSWRVKCHDSHLPAGAGVAMGTREAVRRVATECMHMHVCAIRANGSVHIHKCDSHEQSLE